MMTSMAIHEEAPHFMQWAERISSLEILNIIKFSLIQMFIYWHLLISRSWFIMLKEFNWIYNTYGDWFIVKFILLKCHNLNTYWWKSFYNNLFNVNELNLAHLD
jgi:hypothetical protein